MQIEKQNVFVNLYISQSPPEILTVLKVFEFGEFKRTLCGEQWRAFSGTSNLIENNSNNL